MSRPPDGLRLGHAGSELNERRVQGREDRERQLPSGTQTVPGGPPEMDIHSGRPPQQVLPSPGILVDEPLESAPRQVYQVLVIGDREGILDFLRGAAFQPRCRRQIERLQGRRTNGGVRDFGDDQLSPGELDGQPITFRSGNRSHSTSSHAVYGPGQAVRPAGSGAIIRNFPPQLWEASRRGPTRGRPGESVASS
ncbi:hypothetical protein HK102_011306, partial [Quaeritorhiza haematococci]